MADLALAPPQAAGPAPASPPPTPRRDGVRPGALALRTFVVLYVGVLVLVPVAVLCYRTFQPGFATFVDALSDPDTQHAFQLTAIIAGTATVLDAIFGVAAAILIVRYRFPGRRLLNALIDLPVAVSPIVVGLALILVFGPDGWFGSVFSDYVINAVPGMILATVFVSLPLVLRAIVPVLEQAGTDQEQAATSLGANAVQRFVRITLPTIRVALAYGVMLSLARCVGEYGAVLVVSGNVEGETETASTRIGNILDNDLTGEASAYAITFVLMMISVLAILVGAFIRRRRKN